VVCCSSLREARGCEVSAEAKRPEVRSARRKGIEVLHGYAHFDIVAGIEKWASAMYVRGFARTTVLECVGDGDKRRCEVLMTIPSSCSSLPEA
jgi:hypothetical protein